MPEQALSVAVVGGGWAGCAAACELARLGHKPILFEASRTLGGRARRVELDGRQLDNGQHLLLGAYTATLGLLQLVGVAQDEALLRLPLQMPYAPHPPAMQFTAPRLPAPLHVLLALLRARGLSPADKMAVARFQSTARWMDWMLYQDCSVAELLERYDQTGQVIRMLWRPLCIAALNTPPERASAQVFLNVLKDSLGASRSASDMLLPRHDLSTLFPDRAAAYLQHRGGELHTGLRVQALQRQASAWRVCLPDGSSVDADAVVVAAPAAQAAQLVEAHAPGFVPVFDYEPITTCYLEYDPAVRLPRPFLALLDNPAQSQWGQFVFDRGQLDAAAAGLLAVVVSTSAEALEQAQEKLAQDIARQLAMALGDDRLAAPKWSRVVTEKRATFACTPGLLRPANDTGVPGLWLAGDYTASPYPATIESAVRSGLDAARGAVQSSSRTRVSA